MSVIVLRGTGSVMLSGYVWVIAGLGAVLITPLWAMLAKRTGVANAMIYAFAMQAVSIALPVVFSGLTPTMLGAVGFGGTFLGIVSLTLAYGRQISPGGTTTSVLTVFFSIGQMIGPLIAGCIADSTGGFDLPVLMAASAAALGGLITFIIKKGEHHAVT
jgi:MFS family permease